MSFCFSCCQSFDDEFDICPNCGTLKNTSPKQPTHLCPGTELGPRFGDGKRYIIDTAIGDGGFGIVYRAWDKKLKVIIAIKEFYSIKFSKRGTDKKSVLVMEQNEAECEYRRERFLAEAQYMAKFTSHENIVNVYDCFEENSTIYLTMELLEGINLEQYLKDNGGTLSQPKLVEIVNAVCNALDSMHVEGIVHRDVSPSNIFLCDSGKIKLLDIGSAKLAGLEDDVIDVVTKSGYSPVEQYEGKTDNIGPYTDVYALGATIYRCLVGQRPCESLERQEKDKLRSPHSMNHKIPKKLSKVIMHAMAVDADLRYKDILDFKDAFDDSLEEKEEFRIKYNRFAIREFFVAAICAFGYGLIIDAGLIGSEFSFVFALGCLALGIFVITSNKKVVWAITVIMFAYMAFITYTDYINISVPIDLILFDEYEYYYDEYILDDTDTYHVRALTMQILITFVLLVSVFVEMIALTKHKRIAYELRKFTVLTNFVYVVIGCLNDLSAWIIFLEGDYMYNSNMALKIFDAIGELPFCVIIIAFPVLFRIMFTTGLNDAIKWMCFEKKEN